MSVIEQNRQQLINLCDSHYVKSLGVFGSVLTDNFNAQSDIDFIVDFEADQQFDYVQNYFSLLEKLQNLFNRQIDLLEKKGIRNRFLKKNIENTQQMIYG